MRAAALRGLRWMFALVALLVVYVHFFWAPSYRFAPRAPFEGARWFNPYASFAGDGLRVNFHAHARAWGGLVKGVLAADDVYATYRSRGYDLASISNYQSLAPPPPAPDLYVPTYEHGICIGKQHQTVIGARKVVWFDYPLLQSLRQKQHVLDLLAATCDLVVLNHPDHRCILGGGYEVEDMATLSGYHAIEIATPFCFGVAHWDAALSAGRVVWGIASDDSGGRDRDDRYERGWLVVQGNEARADAIVDAVRAGAFYSVWVWVDRNEELNRLLECRLTGDQLHLRLERPADHVRFFGQDGALFAHHQDVAELSQSLADAPHYARLEIRTRDTTVFLNPLLRCDDPLPVPTLATLATIDVPRTLLGRIGGALLLLAAAALYVTQRHRRRLPLASPPSEPLNAALALPKHHPDAGE